MGFLFVTNGSPLFTAFMQFLNQTYNAGLNYGNRNASSPYGISDLLKGYLAAVVVSMTIALNLKTFIYKYLGTVSSGSAVFVNAFIAYLSCAFAGASNVIFMR